MIAYYINKYIDIINSLSDLIETSPFKTKYIIEKMGMTQSTFYKKLREKKFAPEEVLTLSQFIEASDELDYKDEIIQSMEQARRGEIMHHNDVMEKAYSRFS